MHKILDVLVAFDAKIISIAEYFCHKFQRLTGKTNFFLVVICNMILCAMAFALTFEALHQKQILYICIDIFALALTIYWVQESLSSYKEWEEKAFELLREGLANYRKETELIHRLLILLMASFALVKSFFEIWSGIFLSPSVTGYIIMQFFLVKEYLHCCDPLPPCKSSLKEWFKGFGKVLVPAHPTSKK